MTKGWKALCRDCLHPLTKANSYRPPRCRACENVRTNTRRAKHRPWLRRTKAERQAERDRIAKAKGKAYRTREQIASDRKVRAARKEAVRAARPRLRTAADKWGERLKAELPSRYKAGLSDKALTYRARYYLHPVFRCKELLRRQEHHNRRSRYIKRPISLPRLLAVFMDTKACPYCHTALAHHDKSLDHVVPLTKGGRHTLSNIAICCIACNNAKRARTPAEWRASGR